MKAFGFLLSFASKASAKLCFAESFSFTISLEKAKLFL